MDFTGKSILVTGGTGSFGTAFTQYVLSHYKPKRLVIFSRDEFKQHQMRQKFPHACLRFFLGDVRDEERLHRAFADIDYIIHAAALKHVPACEYNPFEAVRTNILGAQNIINAAIDHGVKRVIALSTDKAANPANLYGATKLCSDKLFIAGNTYAGAADTRFALVRYGNVMGSRGSVIPFFQNCRDTDGVIPITDPRMTRFWITLPQAVGFVLTCIDRMSGGEIFIPKLPSMRVVDLAEAIAPGCPHRIVGIRPGEKLHEVMVPNDEARNTVELPDRYVILPQFEWWTKRQGAIADDARTVPEDFVYQSDLNTTWLSIAELQDLVAQTA